MKITIAYIPGEEREAKLIQSFARSLLGGTKVHESDRHPPFRHIYITTRKAENPYSGNKNTCTIPPDVV